MRADRTLLFRAILVILGTTFTVVFFSTLGHIANTWFSTRGSHGLIIAGISGYMVWLRRKELRPLSGKG